MASGIRIEHIGAGWAELFRSDGMQAVVDDAGKRIASSAGEHFKYYAKPGNYTAMGFVSSRDHAGARLEATEKRLTKAVHR